MDNTFEKLTEILRNGILAAMDDDNRYLYTDVVDYMMAHGVTLATDNNVGDKTNADRIRAMSDEELYKFCLSLTDDGWPFACQNKPECDPIPPKPEWCNECFRKWLKQPVDVDSKHKHFPNGDCK